MIDPPFFTSVLSVDNAATVLFRRVQVDVLLDRSGQFIILSDEDVHGSNGLLVLPDGARRIPITWPPVSSQTRTISFQVELK